MKTSTLFVTALVSTVSAVKVESDASASDFDIDSLFADFFELTSTPTYRPPRREPSKSTDVFIDEFLRSPVPSFELPAYEAPDFDRSNPDSNAARA